MKKILYLLCAICLLCSCSAKQNLTYFSDLQDPVVAQQKGNLGKQDYSINLEPQDELLITVSSEVPEATFMYNLPLSNPATKANIAEGTYAQAMQQTYIVNKEGNIQFPTLGTIHVEGMTTSQLREELTRRISKDVEAPYVRVELLNFKVKVLGEVQHPGVVKSDTERLTVLDALAEVGDMTVFGKRDNVLLVREENGVRTYHYMDLNDSRTMQSPYFYLKQNDVLYVSPTEARTGQAEYNQNNSYKISVISTIVSGASVIASLVIALTVK